MPSVTVPGGASPINLHFDVFDEGDKPWLIFAHGAGGNAACWWQQVPYFIDRYNIVTFDHRAFGRSRCAPENFNPERFADDLLAIMDAAGVERAGLVCQSMGGWTGLNLTLRAPERVWALVMSHTTGGLAAEATAAAVRNAGPRTAPTERFASWAFSAELPQRSPQLAHLYNCIYNANIDFLAMGSISAFRDRSLTLNGDPAANVTPTLFVTGDEDGVIPPSAIEAAQAELPHSELLNLGAVGHSSYFEAAEQFNPPVAAFLAKYGPA